LEFISHNILLPNGEKTMGDRRALLSNRPAWRSIRKTLELLVPEVTEDPASLKVVDLGCLEGGYTTEFARMGCQSLGIEARSTNFQKCLYVKERTQLKNLDFVQDDARNLAKYGPYHIVLCYGILYHFDDPFAFLKKVCNQTKKILLIHTHYAPERDWRYSLNIFNQYVIIPIEARTRLGQTRKNYRLSRMTMHEGYRGRWYTEWSKSDSRKTIEHKNLASYNNPRSFWLCRSDLTKALHDVGFEHVFEQFDHAGNDRWSEYSRFYSRSMFVAIK